MVHSKIEYFTKAMVLRFNSTIQTFRNTRVTQDEDEVSKSKGWGIIERLLFACKMNSRLFISLLAANCGFEDLGSFLVR